MELERYNRSFDEHVESLEEEAERRLLSFRRQCLRDFVNKLTRQQQDWDATFRELLNKSQEEDALNIKSVTFSDKPLIKIIDDDEYEQPILNKQESTLSQPLATAVSTKSDTTTKEVTSSENAKVETQASTKSEPDSTDPFPIEFLDYFTNIVPIKEFIRIQEQQEINRQLLDDINTNPIHKTFKNELNLFIRTQINSISNSNSQHLKLKTKLLTDLFSGQGITFQDKYVSVTKHPQGQLFAMDSAAQTFVTVGTRLVNSVPAIAKSMATVINGIISGNFAHFKDLIFGHLQERCPFTIPRYPHMSDFKDQPDRELKHKIACGYTYDTRTQALESEEKYLSRMRSMILIFACISVHPDHIGQAWTWLASFLSLKPEPVITATILQAFLQEATFSMLSTYGRQFKKLMFFIKTDYIKMIEDVTKQPSERQSLIKLKNELETN